MADLPGSLAAFPRLTDWIAVRADGTVSVRSGKVEIGQGITTALAQLVADELDVAVERVRMVPVTTGASPDEGYTAGSMSIERSGEALRQVCAEVRGLFLDHAATTTGVDRGRLSVTDGTITDDGGRPVATYFALASDVSLDRDATGAPAPKARADRRLIGTAVRRLDLAGKINGAEAFVHDLRLPGMLHGRVVRPPSPAATLKQAGEVKDVVATVRDGDFLGVIATREEDAVSAADALRLSSQWEEHDTLPDERDLGAFLRAGRLDTTVVEEAPAGKTAEPATVVRASYSRPYIAHASIAPSCAIAVWGDGALEVWSHTQGPFPLRHALAEVLGVSDDDVVVHHAEGAGCYGHNGADDVALDAALLARAVPGRPVRVQWSREDELTWAPFGSAMVVDMEVGLDGHGCITNWRFDTWSNTHVTRPGYAGAAGLLAAAHIEDGVARRDFVDRGGMARNAVPTYDIPLRTTVSHCQLDLPIRTSSLRSLGGFANTFAIESFMDELALVAGADPLEFRLRHLSDERGRAVLERVAKVGGWGDGLAKGEACGRGLAFSRYKNVAGWLAVIADVEAVTEVRVRKLTIAADVGMIVNPDGVANQIEGGAVQATSWTLKEHVRFNRTRVTSGSWDDYPILRFSEVPEVEVHLIDRPDEPPLGAGEMTQGPVAAAIANAVYDAIGLRLRDLPLTPERVTEAAAAHQL